jgi:cation transport ATPase
MVLVRHRFTIGVLFLVVIGIRFLIPRFLLGTERDAVAAVLAGYALFRAGKELQRHAIEKLRRFKITGRSLLWLCACVAFWYSFVVLVWWSRKTMSFPLFLLGDHLEPHFYFHWVP